MSVDSQIKDVVQDSREWVEDQIEQLSKQVKLLQKRSRKQVRQLQKQSRKLRKSLRREARKRRTYWTTFSVLLLNSRKYLQNRGENLRVGLVERGGKVSQNVLDFGGKTTQDLAGRSGEFTQELAKRGQRLLEPVRRRVAQQETEQDEHIELPSSNSWNGSGGRPTGEMSYIDQGGTSVATLEIVDVETIEQPADAAFVGVKSTKLFYSVDTELEPKDLVYFTTEEEAKAQGFTAAK